MTPPAPSTTAPQQSRQDTRRDLTQDLAHKIVAVGPHAGAHRVALRAALTVAVPLLLLWGTGHLAWSAYATFGAFCAVYARNDPWRARVGMQARAGAWLALSVTIGAVVALSDHRAWLSVPVTAAFAAVGSLLSDHWGWRPPGPLFTVFALGACSAIPATGTTVLAALLVGSGSVLFGLVVSAVAGMLGARGARAGQDAAPTPPPHVRPTDMGRHAVRAGVAVLLAGGVSTALGIGHPYWAMVSAVVPLMAREWLPALVRGIHRVLGTFVGLAIAAVLLWIDPPGLVVVLLVVVLQGCVELLVMRNYALALLLITPLALLMVQVANPEPMGTLLFDRGLQTLLGVVLGLLVGWAAAQLLPRSKELA
ncbi:FUSC family protein [Nocardioides sp. GY 10127]|nr:FUSC family protein [Nocardioides sp. GY 10127]